MVKSLLLFLQKTFKTNTQLKSENIFLAKQLEIYKRTTLHSQNPIRFKISQIPLKSQYFFTVPL